jgi:predicted Fe-Mo cluster-binding NifX family protein
MKIAITATGNNPSATIDSRFGRCTYIVIYDTEIKSTEYIPNPHKEKLETAGQATLQLIALRGVTKIVSGEFGTKVKSLSDSLKIQLIILPDHKKSVQDIIAFFNR